MLYPVDPYGSLTLLYGGTSPDVLHKDGAVSRPFFMPLCQSNSLTAWGLPQFLIPWAREGPTPPGTTDPALGAKLWEYLENEIKIKGAAPGT